MMIVLLWTLGCVEYSLQDPLANVDTPMDTAQPLVDEPEAAKAAVYANTSTTLFEFDTQAQKFDRIGDFRDATGTVDSFVDIAIDLQGRMFGGTMEQLYRVDPATAEVEPVCDISVSS